jgi:hypothetical protein
MNLMRSILLFVWILGCSSGKLRDPSKNQCVEVREDYKYRFSNCVNGSAAQEFILEGERVLNPKSGKCLPSTGVDISKLRGCSRDHTGDMKLVIKVEGTTVKNFQGFCLFTIGKSLSFVACNNYDNTEIKKVVFE